MDALGAASQQPLRPNLVRLHFITHHKVMRPNHTVPQPPINSLRALIMLPHPQPQRLEAPRSRQLLHVPRQRPANALPMRAAVDIQPLQLDWRRYGSDALFYRPLGEQDEAYDAVAGVARDADGFAGVGDVVVNGL